MAEILSIVSIISYIVAGVSFVLAVVFWFVFNIPTVIGDLSGRNARKSIAKMRKNNEKSGNKSYRPSAINANRGKVTDTMPDSGKLDKDKKKKGKKSEVIPETGLLSENRATSYDTEQTGLLEDAGETALLNESDETGLLVDENATALLSEEGSISKKRSVNKSFKMIEEIMLIHTEETI